MCTYKNILVLCAAVISTHAFPGPYPVTNIDNQFANDYMKDIQNNNLYTAQQYNDIRPVSSLISDEAVRNIQFLPEIERGEQYYVHFPENEDAITPNLGYSAIDLTEPYLRHLRSTQNNGEFNLNSLEFVTNRNIRNDNSRERVKNIREHFKKYMKNFKGTGNTKGVTKHNFEPYNPSQNAIVLKMRDDNNELFSRNKNEDVIKYLHILEGNELLQNTEDTDYTYKIAYSDS